MSSTKFPYVVYWINFAENRLKRNYGKGIKKWMACKSEDKALKLKKLLINQGIKSIWIAKDI